MSPLWHDQLGIFLAPYEVSLCRVSRGLRARPGTSLHQVLEGGGGAGPERALAVLDDALRASEWQNAAAQVVVSNHWARYLLLPWSPAIDTPEERQELARELLAKTYGSQLSQWQIGISDLLPELLQVVCALHPGIIDELTACLAARRIRLVSLVPQLVTSFNQWRVQLGTGRAWFVTVEPGMLCAVELTDGIWQRIHSVRTGPQWGSELKRLCRLSQLADEDREPAKIFVEAPRSLRPGVGQLEVTWLDGTGSGAGAVSQLGALRIGSL